MTWWCTRLDIRLKKFWVWLPAVPISCNNSGGSLGKLFTVHTHAYTSVTKHKMVAAKQRWCTMSINVAMDLAQAEITGSLSSKCQLYSPNLHEPQTYCFLSASKRSACSLLLNVVSDTDCMAYHPDYEQRYCSLYNLSLCDQTSLKT